jgi:hypothetical protein
MSTDLLSANPPQVHAVGLEHVAPYRGVMRWTTTTDHKDIGTLYLCFSLIMFMVGGIMALAIRLELFSPGLSRPGCSIAARCRTRHRYRGTQRQ